MAEQRREIVFEQESPRVCFGCGPDNPRGLGLRFFETEKGVEVDYRVEPHLVGAPGVVHGGIQATLLDEALCMAAYAKHGTPAVTGELTVRYMKPLPSEQDIVVRGHITEQRDRSFFAEGEILIAGSSEVVTRARARLFAMQEDSAAGS